MHHHRRISAASGFPLRSDTVQLHFEKTAAVNGVCFAFSVLFFQDEKMKPCDPIYEEKLVRLQLAHELDVKTHGLLLSREHRMAYGLRILAEQKWPALDSDAIQKCLASWQADAGPTCVMVAMTVVRQDGARVKHFTPLYFSKTAEKWEVGDTTFALDCHGNAQRYGFQTAALGIYLSWQADYCCDKQRGVLSELKLLHIGNRR